MPTLPGVYGLPKIHKEGNPLRPIVSTINSVNYKLAAFLSKHLTPLLNTIANTHIINNDHFIDRIKNHHLINRKMVSFDVKSLFTNVPVSECVQFLKERLPTTNFNIPFSNSVFIKLLELCVSDCFFSFNNEFYKQIYGLPMGSPISPVLANIYMEFLESRLLPTVSGSIIEWCRFVDDVYAIVPDTLNIDEFLVKLNDFNPNIKFTLEIENNGELPFRFY